ncbi:hypothetical protein FJZ36_00775 [Candidatus Poribacteria bacterium]|nr:hypothetical protein [Candidatus Poribacteria bacterium]
MLCDILLAAAVAGSAATSELPVLVCPKLPAGTAPPTIDGRLDDPAWLLAERAELRLAATGETPRQPTTAGLTWDDEYLYVAFDCVDADTEPNATMIRRDANLWEEEVVEVFLSPSGELHTYAELEVNPLNTLFDAMILNNGRRTQVLRDWNMERIRHAVATTSTGWSVEMALPLDEFYTAPHAPPKVGDEWRMNLYRIDRSEPGAPELSSWSQTLIPNFHNASRFGYLRFGDERTPR